MRPRTEPEHVFPSPRLAVFFLERYEDAGHALTGITLDLEIPKPKHAPPRSPKLGVHACVSGAIVRNLCVPERAGLAPVVLRMAVPERAIDEDCQPSSRPR